MSEKSFVSQMSSSKSKTIKKFQTPQPNPVHEKFSKLLLSFDKSLADWKSCSLSGNSIITDDILSKKKAEFSSGKFT